MANYIDLNLQPLPYILIDLLLNNAIIFLNHFWTKPQVAAKKAVEAPTKVITNRSSELYSNIGDDLTNK